ncbi:hypothetical protein GWI33_005378 [Rhynchophorus ferrugineus]|uniref:Uncharacterized protein n=1 Tax=Rhynchophorus ferrugineus TaxID=354439 RepID=A0A834IKM2_RHYFE|nr:hypothetical protein GWI33_005378 [Rhynchophorus ferrugineus]
MFCRKIIFCGGRSRLGGGEAAPPEPPGRDKGPFKEYRFLSLSSLRKLFLNYSRRCLRKVEGTSGIVRDKQQYRSGFFLVKFNEYPAEATSRTGNNNNS